MKLSAHYEARSCAGEYQSHRSKRVFTAALALSDGNVFSWNRFTSAEVA
ncbi:hypothetical protein E3G69_004212 [Mycobacteroides abscessus]|nr:hypothetical protein [Mycobacteroides abscessus]QOF45155.1 hypothetical protein E3G69_004212 [Mycobacteroides abscessus]QOF49853.1 hypothetical protein E3G70_004210 [Mycobacteroides abscessus]